MKKRKRLPGIVLSVFVFLQTLWMLPVTSQAQPVEAAGPLCSSASLCIDAGRELHPFPPKILLQAGPLTAFPTDTTVSGSLTFSPRSASVLPPSPLVRLYGEPLLSGAHGAVGDKARVVLVAANLLALLAGLFGVGYTRYRSLHRPKNPQA